MKKIITGYLFVLVSFSAIGQNVVPDSLLYFLVEQTIENIETVRIYKYLRIPSLPLKINKEGGIGESSFTHADTTFIQYQIDNPVVSKWEKKKFKSKIYLTKTFRSTFPFLSFKGKETYLISLPLFSKDLQTAEIYYESYHKFKFSKMSTGAGFEAVWRQANGKWKLIKTSLVWITQRSNEKAMPTTSHLPFTGFSSLLGSSTKAWYLGSHVTLQHIAK